MHFKFALRVQQFKDNILVSKLAPMLALATWGDTPTFEQAMRSLNRIKVEDKVDPAVDIVKAAAEFEEMRQKESEVFGPTDTKKRIHIKQETGDPLAGVKIKGGKLTHRTSHNSEE